jgi:hypothetical protein
LPKGRKHLFIDSPARDSPARRSEHRRSARVSETNEDSEPAKRVHAELSSLDLPTLNDVRDKFERRAEELGVPAERQPRRRATVRTSRQFRLNLAVLTVNRASSRVEARGSLHLRRI